MNIYQASAVNDVNTIRQIVKKKGRDVLNLSSSKKQNVPLHHAAYYSHLEAVEFILNQTDEIKGFYINIYATNNEQHTVLHSAFAAYHNAKDNDQQTRCLEIIKQVMLYEAKLREKKIVWCKDKPYLKNMQTKQGIKPFDLIISYTKRSCIDSVIKGIQQKYPSYLRSNSFLSKLTAKFTSIFGDQPPIQQEEKESLLSMHLKHE